MALRDEAGCADWLRAGAVVWADDAALCGARHRPRERPTGDTALVFHPPVLALGIGCERDCAAEEIAALAEESLAAAGLAAAAVAAIVSVELKLGRAGHPRARRAARRAGAVLRRRAPARRDAAPQRALGGGVSRHRLLGGRRGRGARRGRAGRGARRRRNANRGGATCAVARAAAPIDAAAIGRPRGRLAIVGIGPGDAAWRTPEASALLAKASDIVGYGLYLDLLGRAAAGKTLHPGTLGAETERARLALDLAAAARGRAGLVGRCRHLRARRAGLRAARPRASGATGRAVEIVVSPGVSAMQAAAARAGAPLGHDFCAISLSDLMTPWPAIRARLEAAAAGDFVVALYNPRSARRQAGLAEAAAILLAAAPAERRC